ncbi:MAG: UvrD-helicase domain-containing protein [Steroidobacteraceae bacterium]|nr:UvrD-helicase domain-containing protein [Steroidobacteraceae bacterium]
MTDLRRSDEQARERALDVTRSFIVQAPAGSGKTELLIRRFLALLATVTAPESVLAITFTRKAAAEKRDRILRALRAAKDPASAGGRLPHARTLELARTALAVDTRLGWDLLGNPARLRIQTIDALNFGLARRLPVLSGLGADLAVEDDASDLYHKAAERLLEHLPGGEDLHSRAVATLLAHVDNRVPKFVDLVIEMLARRDAWGPVLPEVTSDEIANADLRASLERARAELVEAHLAALAREFPADLLADAAAVACEAAATLMAAGSESPIAEWAGQRNAPQGVLADKVQWLGLAALLLTTSGTPRMSFDYRVGFPPGKPGAPLKQRAMAVASALAPLEELTARLDAVRRLPGPRYSTDEWRVLQAQLVVLRLAAAELEVVFSERRLADYPRIAAAAQQSLGSDDAPTDTALALDATLQHLLVDEFQDTSEAQVSLLGKLTSGWQRDDGRTLFLVGDPMQSIYRFRNAEVGLFLDVRERGLGDLVLEPLSLAVNYRSAGPLVDWVNGCFAQVLPALDDEVTGAVTHSASVAAMAAGADGSVQVHPLFRRSRLFEACSVADVVEQRLAEDDDADIAILVQGRSHLLHIVGELVRRGVAFQATDIDPLGERPIVLDLLALTRAIAHPADRPAWLAVLRAPWCGLTLAELHALCGDRPGATLPQLLRDDERRGRLGPDARARLGRLWTILEAAPVELRRFGLRDTVERAWLALGGPATAGPARELDEAQTYFDELAKLERRARGFVDLGRLAEALEKLYAPSRPDASIRVHLLTVHKAKGLEFDTVIVPGLERRSRSDDKRLLQWARLPGAGGRGLVVAPLAGTGDDPNPLYRWLEGLESGKLLQEKRRLLYVAATRAKHRLHLFGSCALKGGDGGGPTIVTPPSTVALGMLWPAVESAFQARLAGAATIEGETPPVIARDPLLRRLPLGWSMPALKMPRIESSSRPRATTEPPVQFDWASETARHVGTVVHRELLRIVGGSAGPSAHAQGSSATRRYRDELAELGVPADRRADAVQRVATAVKRTLEDERGRWLLGQHHSSSYGELALSGRVNGDVVSVVIDRTFVDGQGTRWIVDYKTSTHEGAGLEEFLDREQQRYSPQLERYAALVRHLGPEPIRLGLYFPLLSAWRDWT